MHTLVLGQNLFSEKRFVSGATGRPQAPIES